MSKAVFISFDHDDEKQVGGLRAAISNPNNAITFLDRSLKAPVKDSYGSPIVVPPSDIRATRVKSEISSLMNESSKMVVLIGRNTHSSLWVQWEIDNFRRTKGSSGRILCMRLRGDYTSGAPNNAGGISVVNWDLDYLKNWIG